MSNNDLKKLVFYPILFSIDPILLLLTGNLSVIPLHQVFPVIVIVPILAAGIFWLFNRLFKNVHRAGFTTFIILFWFFHYGTVYQLFKLIKYNPATLELHIILLTIWMVGLILLSSKMLWTKLTNPLLITSFLNIVCIALTAYSLVRITSDHVMQRTYSPTIQKDLQVSINAFSGQKPDVYYIILDGYARGDVLQEIYSFDNADFLGQLAERGFFVASDSQSNYMQTPLSLASSLNMTYISGVPGWMPDRGLLIGMIQNNRTWAIFKQLGYKLVTFTSGYLPTDIANSDYYFSAPSIAQSNDLVGLLLNNSIAIIPIEQGWIKTPNVHIGDAQQMILGEFTNLENDVLQIDGPKFVFMHIIAPHPPFIFNQTSPVDLGDPYILIDGKAFLSGSRAYVEAYINQLRFINEQVIQSIDSILAKSTIPPIIVIQADHGPGAYLDNQSADNSCLKERFSILNAYRLPGGINGELRPDITPVNTFPAIFKSVFNLPIAQSDEYEYFSNWFTPYEFIDVSEISQSTCQLP